MFGVIGLLLGLIVGFIATNWMNRSALSAAPTAVPAAGPLDANANTSQLPPNHPPIGSNGGDQAGTGGGPLPQVQAAIDKAKQNPQDYEAQMTAGDLYYQIQRFEEAAKFYEAAIKIKPGDKEAMDKAGIAYFDQGASASSNGDDETATRNFVAAKKWYQQVLAKDPKNADVMADLGFTYMLAKPSDVERGMKECKAAFAIDPKRDRALQCLAQGYKLQGDTANYQKTLDEIRVLNPRNPMLTQSGQ